MIVWVISDVNFDGKTGLFALTGLVVDNRCLDVGTKVVGSGCSLDKWASLPNSWGGGGGEEKKFSGNILRIQQRKTVAPS